MVLRVFTKGDGPETRAAKELGQRFEERDFVVDYYDAEDEAATTQLELYDLYSFPSFVATMDDGTEVGCWRGKVPLFGDVLGFLDR